MILDEAIAYAHKEFELVQKEKGIPGIAFGLIHNGVLVYSSGVGERIIGGPAPDADSIFRIASMSKSFTAQAILLLRDRGLLSLDDHITQYLPWTSTIGIPAGSAQISIRDVLTMGAGFPTDDPWGDRQENLPLEQFDSLIAAGITFNRNVNTAFEYSNLGYALLGRIISEVSGVRYEDFMKNEIQIPQGMTRSSYFTEYVPEDVRAVGYVKFDAGLIEEPVTSTGAFTPMGGLHSSVRELTSWVAMFQAGKAEAQVPYRHIQSTLAKAQDDIVERIVTASYGYGLFIEDDSELGRFVSHSGGYPGFGSHMRWHHESSWGIIALGNLTYAPMSVIGAKVMNQIVHLHMKENPKKVVIAPRTIEAMKTVESLLEKWDDTLADEWFAVNMDLDQPRNERRAALEKILEGNLNIERVESSVTSSTLSHAKWSVQSGSKSIEIEMLMSPEKNPRIQKLVIK